MNGTEDHLTVDQVQETYGQLPDVKELFYDWMGLNNSLFNFINGYHNPSYDMFMQFATSIGNKHFFPYYLMFFAACALLGCLIKKFRKKAGIKQYLIQWFTVFCVMIAGFIVTAGVVHFLKDFFHYPRPYAILPAAEVILIELRPNVAYQSFPSGHASFITMIVASLWPILSTRMRFFGIFLVLLVSWSRVSLGVHFPADTMGGALIALTVVIAVRIVVKTILHKVFGLVSSGS